MTRRSSLPVVAVISLLAAVSACGGDDATTTTQAPATSDAPVTAAPATDAPATDAPATDAPVTEPPVTEPPATDPPATDAPDDTSPEPAHSDPPNGSAFEITADVVGGQPVGGVRSYLVEQGTTVMITITSDATEEAHLHGYDIEAEIGPDGPAVMTFDATETGSFELELHGSGALVAYIDVT